MPPPWTSFFCSVYPDGHPDQWVHVAITTVPLRWVGAVLLNIAGVPRASAVSGLFPTPPLGWLFLAFVLHVLASFRSTLGNWVVRASSAPILTAEFAVHRTKASPWYSPSLSLLCRSVVRVCFATSCGPVYLRRWRSPSSILCLSGRAQQGFGQEPQRLFQRASVLLEAGFAIHCIGSCSLGIWPNRFLPYSSRLACKCRKIEEWSLSTGSPYFLRIHVRLSLFHDVFDLPLFL